MNPSPLKQALAGAPDKAPVVDLRADREYFLFRVGELRLGVPSENVREVIRAGPLIALPRAAPFVIGLTGHRGEVLPVLDLLRFFGKGESRLGPRTRLFVGMAGAICAALVTDGVVGLRRIAKSEIHSAPTGGDSSSEHLLGVVRSAHDTQTLALLDLAKLLQSARQRAVAR